MEKVTVDVSQQSLSFMHDSLEVNAHAGRLNCTDILFDLGKPSMIIKFVSKSHQFADVLAPHLSSTGMFRHEGDAVQLREEVVQTLHAGTKRQVGTVQTGLYVVPVKT